MKTFWLFVALSLSAIAVIRCDFARAEPNPPTRDVAKEVRGVFAAKCAACHGSDLAKPKGRFGYVLDLRRVAANPEMVIPLRPAESELWQLVERNEMPPSDSRHGPLTRAQKEIIRDWIAAGAPDTAPTGSAPGRQTGPGR
jgi:mono/diheme cytochrome c family protein